MITIHYILVTQSCPTLCDPMDCIACQATLSMGFSRQYWSGLSFPSVNQTSSGGPHQVCHIGGGCTTGSNRPVGAELQNSREFIIICSPASWQNPPRDPEKQAHRKTLTDFPESSSSSGPLPPFPAPSPALPVSSTTSAAQVAQPRGLQVGGFRVAREDRTFVGTRPGFVLSAPGSCDRRDAVLACRFSQGQVSLRLRLEFATTKVPKLSSGFRCGVFSVTRPFESQPDAPWPRLGGSSAGGFGEASLERGPRAGAEEGPRAEVLRSGDGAPGGPPGR